MCRPEERLESLSVVSAIYLCDLCRQVANTDAVVRATLLEVLKREVSRSKHHV